jgi:hypothetical protein
VGDLGLAELIIVLFWIAVVAAVVWLVRRLRARR